MCKPCLSALVTLPEADLARFDIGIGQRSLSSTLK
jgi:hypothetical protein